MEIANQVQQWLDEHNVNLDDFVVWDTHERLSGLGSYDIDYLHTIPKK